MIKKSINYFLEFLITPISILLFITTTNSKLNRIETALSEASVITEAPLPDSLKQIVAPQMQTKGNYYLFSGESIGGSVNLLDYFDYDSAYPIEVLQGFITPVRSNNGAGYYLWTQNKLSERMPISMWVMTDPNPQKYQFGFEKNPEYTKIIFPVAPVIIPN